MMFLSRLVVFVVVLLMLTVATSGAESFSQRFEKGSSSFGGQLGWGHTVDLPPGRNRTDLGFAFFFPNWQRNLSGITGDSWSRGAWFYHMEAGVAFNWCPSAWSIADQCWEPYALDSASLDSAWLA